MGGTAKQRITNGEFNIFLLDEFTYLLDFGWLDTAEVIDGSHPQAGQLHLIITGRNAPRA